MKVNVMYRLLVYAEDECVEERFNTGIIHQCVSETRQHISNNLGDNFSKSRLWFVGGGHFTH